MFNELPCIIPLLPSNDPKYEFQVETQLNENNQGNKRIKKHTINPRLSSFRVYPLKEGKPYRLYLNYDYADVFSNIFKLDFIQKVIFFFYFFK